MNAELITYWGEHDSSLHKLLALAEQTLCIFDEDLSKLKLESAGNAELLRRLLAADERNSLRIVLKNAEPFRRSSPRLMKLLANYPLRMTVLECPEHLASLGDSLFIVDDRHALVRFNKDHARAKVITDNTEECMPYVHRFEEILKEGGEQVCATTLGL